ncbi:hypothetical protein [Ornithinimicrobium kibberense]|uniref:hypothetical protein n=1 Tax=Ornithinimicrobium kibberense TaxID=282060 RepID=UPI0036127DCF
MTQEPPGLWAQTAHVGREGVLARETCRAAGVSPRVPHLGPSPTGPRARSAAGPPGRRRPPRAAASGTVRAWSRGSRERRPPPAPRPPSCRCPAPRCWPTGHRPGRRTPGGTGASAPAQPRLPPRSSRPACPPGSGRPP